MSLVLQGEVLLHHLCSKPSYDRWSKSNHVPPILEPPFSRWKDFFFRKELEKGAVVYHLSPQIGTLCRCCFFFPLLRWFGILWITFSCHSRWGSTLLLGVDAPLMQKVLERDRQTDGQTDVLSAHHLFRPSVTVASHPTCALWHMCFYLHCLLFVLNLIVINIFDLLCIWQIIDGTCFVWLVLCFWNVTYGSLYPKVCVFFPHCKQYFNSKSTVLLYWCSARFLCWQSMKFLFEVTNQ